MIYITDEAVSFFRFGIFNPVDPHVDYNAPRGDHLLGYHTRSSRGGYQNLRPTSVLRKIPGSRVTHRHRGVPEVALLGEHNRKGAADEVAAADDDHLFAGDLDTRALEDLDHPVGRTRIKAVKAAKHTTQVHWVKTVHILVRIDGGDDPFGVYVSRKRQLYKYSMNLRIPVELINQGEQFPLGHLHREPMVPLEHPRLFECPLFAPNVGETRRILTDEYHRQAGSRSLRRKLLGVAADLFSHRPRQRFAIQ